MNGYLISGILLFCLAHMFPAVCHLFHDRVIKKLGRNPYRGLFALLIFIALTLIVYGWRSSEVELLFEPPEWGYIAAQLIMYPVLFLFIASGTESNIKRHIRHPQLTSVFLWGVAHLLANGESRSVLLFGSFAMWSIVEIIFLNRRDGIWQKPEKVTSSKDIKTAAIAIIFYIILTYTHVYFTGIPLLIE